MPKGFLVFFPGPRRADETGSRKLTNKEFEWIVEALDHYSNMKSPEVAQKIDVLIEELRGRS